MSNGGRTTAATMTGEAEHGCVIASRRARDKAHIPGSAARALRGPSAWSRERWSITGDASARGRRSRNSCTPRWSIAGEQDLRARCRQTAGRQPGTRPGCSGSASGRRQRGALANQPLPLSGICRGCTLSQDWPIVSAIPATSALGKGGAGGPGPFADGGRSA